MTYLELASTVLLLVAVALSSRAIVWGFPLGIVGLSLSLPVYWSSLLYAEAGLQLTFIAFNAYGWWAWLRGGKRQQPLPISRSPLAEQLAVGAVCLLGAGGLSWVLQHYTDSDVPWLDALTTCFSLGAQWLLARKRLENWLWWIVLDMVYVGLYGYKELFFFAGLYGLYVALAAYGYFHWRNEWKS